MKRHLSKWYQDLESLLRKGMSPENKVFARRYAIKAKTHIDGAIRSFDKEAGETREMAATFFRLLEENLNLNDRKDSPTREEVRAAVEQLKDVGRFSVFATAVILPGGVLSLIGLELLAKRYGIQFSFIPSAFRKRKSKEDAGNKSAAPVPLPGIDPAKDPHPDPAAPYNDAECNPEDEIAL